MTRKNNRNKNKFAIDHKNIFKIFRKSASTNILSSSVINWSNLEAKNIINIYIIFKCNVYIKMIQH